jgi:hypothetical protein
MTSVDCAYVCLRQLFDEPPENRTETTLHNLFRSVWLKQKAAYEATLFPTVPEQRDFGLEGLRLLSNYFRVSLALGSAVGDGGGPCSR